MRKIRTVLLYGFILSCVDITTSLISAISYPKPQASMAVLLYDYMIYQPLHQQRVMNIYIFTKKVFLHALYIITYFAIDNYV